MLNSISGSARMRTDPCRRVALLGVFLAVLGLANTSWASGFVGERPTGRQFLGMSELERLAYVSGFMWGSAAQLADAHLRVDSCGSAVLQHAPADEIAKNLAMAIAETAGAGDLPVWIMLSDVLIATCNYRPGL